MEVVGPRVDAWDADVDAEALTDGKFVPVLLLVPPASVGPPLLRRLAGDYEHDAFARMAVLDAMAAMTHRSSERKG